MKRPSPTIKLLVLIGLLVIAFVFLLVKERKAMEQPIFDYITPHITDISCDAEKACPQGLECWALEAQPVCVDPDPCRWHCGKVDCVVMESYPLQLRCE